MTREHAQIPLPRMHGVPVSEIAESVVKDGVKVTAYGLEMSEASVRRAVQLWEQWRRQTGAVNGS